MFIRHDKNVLSECVWYPIKVPISATPFEQPCQEIRRNRHDRFRRCWPDRPARPPDQAGQRQGPGAAPQSFTIQGWGTDHGKFVGPENHSWSFKVILWVCLRPERNFLTVSTQPPKRRPGVVTITTFLYWSFSELEKWFDLLGGHFQGHRLLWQSWQKSSSNDQTWQPLAAREQR